MPEHIECSDCGEVIFGYVASEPRPIDGDECPSCGGTNFETRR